MRSFRLVLLFVLFTPVLLRAQDDFAWWNTIHHWDGHTSWVQYVPIAPAFMGPNALPVPQVQNGSTAGDIEVEQLAGAHFSKGDKTQDFFSRVSVPLMPARASVEFYVVPYERFSTDTLTRDLRAARTRSGKGSAGGDIYFSTQISLVKDKSSWPDVALELACRTASGTRLRDARYTDAAGYFFDLSFGKSITLDTEKKRSLRLYAMGGFYTYQTYDIENLQNDCVLYGLGANLDFTRFSFDQQFAGYAGYLHNGDHPAVYRAALRWKHAHVDWKLIYQWGLNDFPYQTLRAGVIVHYVSHKDAKR